VTPVGLSIASLFMSLERIEGLSKVPEPRKEPLVLFDSAMATGRQTEKRGGDWEREGELNGKGEVGGEENERQMANNVNAREMGL